VSVLAVPATTQMTANPSVPLDTAANHGGAVRTLGWAAPVRSGDADAVAWARVRAVLRAESGDHHFDAWLAPLVLVGADGDRVRLAAPSAFVADWVGSHYAEALRQHWAAQRPGTRHVVINVQSAGASPAAVSGATPTATAPVAPLPVESRYSFDNFIVGKSNELAYNAALAVAEPGPLGFNPLFLHGTTGLGKTHLMHAIGNAFLARQPGAKVTYMSAERFMVEFLAALRA